MKCLLPSLKGLLILCLLLLASCGQGNGPVAEQGLQASMRQLPELKEFDEIATKIRVIEDIEHFNCYDGVANIAFGTSLTELEALDTYTDALVSQGWKYSSKEEEEPEQRSRVLIKKSGGLINVSLSSGEAFTDNTDYDQAKDNYSTVIFVRLHYHPPCK